MIFLGEEMVEPFNFRHFHSVGVGFLLTAQEDLEKVQEVLERMTNLTHNNRKIYFGNF